MLMKYLLTQIALLLFVCIAPLSVCLPLDAQVKTKDAQVKTKDSLSTLIPQHYI